MNFPLLSVWLLWILRLNTIVVMATTIPEKRFDVIGTYRVSSRVQCLKLCWYRQLCTSVSHTTTRSRGKNCVLHSNHVEDAGSDEASNGDWEETTASKPSTSGGCDDRLCDICSICVRRSDGGHDCLPVPVTCTDRDHAPLAVVVVAPTTATASCPEDRENCAQPLGHNPTGAPQCQGRWRLLTGECVQAVHVTPAMGLYLRLPSPVMQGWQACFRGVFTGDRMALNFLQTEVRIDDIVLHVDFRRRFPASDRTIIVNSQINGQWPANDIELRQPPMTLEPGDSFTINIRVTASTLMMTLNGDVHEMALSDLHVDISMARFVGLVGEVQPQYVNLAGPC